MVRRAALTWQHGDFEIHVSVAVAYAVWHYVKVCGDKDFLYRQGIEMLLEICRFYAVHGEYSPRDGDFGLYGVMGPDEYHMNVNNNCYTNVMVKKAIEYTLAVVEEMERTAPQPSPRFSTKLRCGLASWPTGGRRPPKCGFLTTRSGTCTNSMTATSTCRRWMSNTFPNRTSRSTNIGPT